MPPTDDPTATPRLVYFEMRGRAEAIRLFLHATATAFEDHRVVTAEEWKRRKPELPFGGLPVLETGGTVLCESHAILRHLGRATSAPIADPLTAANLDAAQDALAESQEDLWRFNWIDDYYDQLESYANQTLRRRLERLDAWLARSASEWIGPTFGHVDCLAFGYLDEVDAFFPAVLAGFPALSALHARVAARPGIADYLRSDARPVVFGMGRMGPKVDPRTALPPGYAYPTPWSDPIDLSRVLAVQRRMTEG